VETTTATNLATRFETMNANRNETTTRPEEGTFQAGGKRRNLSSRVGAGAMLTDPEPRIPGGETPPSTAGGTPAATEARFMESSPAHGPCSRALNRGGSIGGFQSRRDCDPKPGVARHELPRVGRAFGANPNGVAPAVRNPVGVVNSRNLPPGVGPRRGPTPGFGTESRWDSRMGRRRDDEDAGRFMESRVGAGAMLTDHEPGRIPGGETPPSTARFMDGTPHRRPRPRY
jgi:hypothetical protein